MRSTLLIAACRWKLLVKTCGYPFPRTPISLCIAIFRVPPKSLRSKYVSNFSFSPSSSCPFWRRGEPPHLPDRGARSHDLRGFRRSHMLRHSLRRSRLEREFHRMIYKHNRPCLSGNDRHIFQRKSEPQARNIYTVGSIGLAEKTK
jgi:hypothetical protein